LAVQVRQNTAQLKREETVSIQRGQNEVIAQLSDPATAKSYAMMAEKGRRASPEDQARAILYVIQYINLFQIVYDLYHLGSLDEERYKLWEGFAILEETAAGLAGGAYMCSSGDSTNIGQLTCQYPVWPCTSSY